MGRPEVSVVLFVKFLHIAAMFCAVGVSVGTDLMAHRIAGTGDVRSIRTFFAQSRRLVMLMPVLFLTGLGLGLLTAWTGALNLFAPWLVIAYILFALTLALHATVGARWFRRMDELAIASPDERPSGELLATALAPSARYLTWYTIAMVVFFVFLMVTKPFS
jgi:hypothetical protein